MTDTNTDITKAASAIAAAPGAEVQGPSLVQKMAKKVPLNLLKFWWAFVLIPGLAIGVAAVGSGLIASTTWTFKTTILYSQIPIDEAAEKLYLPPDLKTLATMITSPVVLSRTCDELDLAVPPRVLQKLIAIEDPKSMQRIGLELGWADPDKGREILNKLTEVYALHVSNTRKEIVNGYLKDLEDTRVDASDRLSKMLDKLNEFNAREGIRDAEADMVTLIRSIDSLEFKLGTEKRRINDMLAQKKNVEDRLNKQKEEEQLASKEAKDAEAAEESVADNRRRQDRLNELIVEERRLNEIRGVLFAKQQEFNRKLKLYERGYISQAMFQTVDAEVKALKAKIMEGSKITEWKKELAIIDKVVVPSGKSKRKGSPVIQQTLFKLIEIELDMLESESERNQLMVDITEKRKKILKIQSLGKEFTRMQKDLDAASDARTAINKQYSALKAIRDYGPHEFSVIAPATSAMSFPSTNRKKYFILFFGAISVGLSTPFILLAVLLSFKQTVDEGCSDRGIPVLSPKKSILSLLTESSTETQSEVYGWARFVSLRVQQSLPKVGSVISVFSASHRHFDVKLMADVARILAQRDERVLIVESSPAIETLELQTRRKAHGQQTAAAVLRDLESEFGTAAFGLFDYLHGHVGNVDELLGEHSDSKTVDFISVGKVSGKFDRLFSQRMHDLMGELRNRYSVVLFYGPELHRTVDVEMQTRHSDGIVLLHDRGEPLTHGIRTTLDGLGELNAPIWGTLLRPRCYSAPARPRFVKRLTRQLRPLVFKIRSAKQRMAERSFVGKIVRVPVFMVRVSLKSIGGIVMLPVRILASMMSRVRRRKTASSQTDTATKTIAAASGDSSESENTSVEQASTES